MKLILVVIDGLTPAVFEDAVESGATPALAFLAEHGSYGRGVSTFPSLTPVCLSSIATGAHPDVHRIPHLVWYHRGERRVVEYGSSFAAIRAAGTPCIVTLRLTATPIAAIFASPTHTPVYPRTRIAAIPNWPRTSMSVFSRSRTYRTTSSSSARRSTMGYPTS